MKTIFKIFLPVVTLLLFSAGCKKFEEINRNPYLANADQVQAEFFLNGSIAGAQMNPHIAERIFVLYWKTAGHQQFGGGISTGGYNDGWSSDYYGSGYMGKWLNMIYKGIDVAEKQIASGNIKPYTNNLLQICRIWRAYLLSELADTFGPIPIDGFQGVAPEFASVKDVYYFLLAELSDASSKIDINVAETPASAFDKAYGFDYAKWQKYANSMRLRLAMRLSEVDPGKAQTEFEAASSLPLLMSADESFSIEETGGWNDMTGVMTREWNYFQLSATLKNLMVNLGGVPTFVQITDSTMRTYIQDADYIGMRFLNHFPTMTNDPTSGYWMDGLPEVNDPRAYVAFPIPGNFDDPHFNSYPSWNSSATTTQRDLVDADGNVVKSLDAKYTWNAPVNGDWGEKGSKNQIGTYNGAVPRLADEYRNSSNSRVFFAPWETYFLLAEGTEYGWSTPMSGKEAYEAGIDASFAFWGVDQYAADYKASTGYNLVGTSVSWDHTAEPPATHTMDYVDGYTGTAGTVEIAYPVNDLYKNGTVRNDHLTKIITQKFIAQNPWMPRETWCDQRRLGLPFFENPAVEDPLTNMPDLNSSNYMTSSIKFFPQRVKYPSSIQSTNSAGYDQAVSLLGGPDNDLTPLWWAQHD